MVGPLTLLPGWHLRGTQSICIKGKLKTANLTQQLAQQEGSSPHHSSKLNHLKPLASQGQQTYYPRPILKANHFLNKKKGL
jgi:hypothetical protein